MDTLFLFAAGQVDHGPQIHRATASATVFDADGNLLPNAFLTPIPEPSAAGLLGMALVLGVAFERSGRRGLGRKKPRSSRVSS